jgi:hypothetical protein
LEANRWWDRGKGAVTGVIGTLVVLKIIAWLCTKDDGDIFSKHNRIKK